MAWAVNRPPDGGTYGLPGTLFPTGNWWKVDISAAPVDPLSSQILGRYTGNLRYDFGSNYGMPYCTVSGDYPKIRFQGASYWSESDDVDYPIPVESITQPGWTEQVTLTIADRDMQDGDRHMLIYDVDNEYLYEIYQIYYNATASPVLWSGTTYVQPGNYYCAGCCRWDLKTNNVRTEGWTSADASGLQILPGLVRYDEVMANAPITHAHRICFNGLRSELPYYAWPATHYAPGARWYPDGAPLGMRLRLKASIDLSYADPFPHAKRVLESMKTYGLIVADNGSVGNNGDVTGTNDARWGEYDSPIRTEFIYAFNILTPLSYFEVIELGWTPTKYWHTNVGDSRTLGATWPTTLGYSLRSHYAEPWETSTYAVANTTVASALSNITTLLVQVPQSDDGANLKVLVNLGANEMTSLPSKATWVSNYQSIIDAIVTLQPSAKVFCAKPWRRGYDANATTMAGWVDEVAASRSGVAFVGHDERVWLRGTDNGVAMTTDGLNYSTAGHTEAAAQWLTIITDAGGEPSYQQYVYPTADVTDGNWLNELGSATDLFESVNDATTYDDDTYIQSALAPSSDTVVMQLGTMTAPTSGSCALTVRAKLG